MYEFDQFEVSDNSAEVTPGESLAYVSGIARRSLLFWSEHCIECAAPECYSSCDLYRARPDQRCRRFKQGVRRNTAFKSAGTPAAEIVFDQWGKLEARGNAYLLKSSVINLVERALYRVLPVCNWVGRQMQRFDKVSPWSSLSFELTDIAARRLHLKASSSVKPDGFLIEIYNPEQSECRLTFECAVSRSAATVGKPLPVPVLKRLELSPGYNRCFLEYSIFKSIVESGLPYNLSFVPELHSGTHLVFLTLDFVQLAREQVHELVREPVRGLGQERAGISPAADNFSASNMSVKSVVPIVSAPTAPVQQKPAAKCVVFDLDNTLWDGVLLEGTVRLNNCVPELLATLDKRGVLMSVVSKNNATDALAKLEELGLKDYFLYPMINWSRKSQNIQQLINKLSIGADTVLFVDDNPFEREEVAGAVPEVEVLDETLLQSLLDHPRLVGGTTAESASRRKMYKQQIERESAQIEFGDDYLRFLKECEIEVTIGPSQDKFRNRIEELLQRTNQLNFSGKKYSRQDVVRILADANTDKHVIHCRDKFGDYGLVGFSISQTNAAMNSVTVKDFMLSCRVQGKLIEKAFFNFLAEHYLSGAGELKINFTVTDRNALAQQVLREIGFDMTTDAMPALQVEPGDLDVDFLRTHTPAPADIARSSLA